MEILALLLLGLIAMLAIVPPIIRGKIEESPLATTQSFQRSMEEIAHSIESGSLRSARAYEARFGGGSRAYAEDTERKPFPRPAPGRRRASAATRRNRVFSLLTLLAFSWGAATLFSGKAWCLALFVSSSIMLIVFWLLTIIVPYLAAPARTRRREGGRGRHLERHPDRRAV
ncbi:MAG: hypothetical protein H5T74_09935 [Actinobacteria bacterium]|nr:hypothetical protein [Actinomycetota bacterium]MDI6830517.1 hypothetical protein [Actinomycetota bacterium]